jgi:hypothetical protein
MFLVRNITDIQECKIRIRHGVSCSPGITLFSLIDIESKDHLLIRLNSYRVVSIDATHLSLKDASNLNSARVDAFKSHIYTTLKTHTKYAEMFNERKEHSCNQSDLFRFVNLVWRDVTCFDVEDNMIQSDCILPNDLVSFIVYPRYVWMNSTHYGIAFKLVQLLRNEPLGLKTNLFLPSEYARHKPPPPPPPPPMFVAKINSNKNINSITAFEVRRPTLQEILIGRQKLRLTNLLSD